MRRPTGSRGGAPAASARCRRFACLAPPKRIAYTPCEKAKSDLYALLLPALTSRKVQLLDHARLIAQLTLERRTAWGGRDSIDHAPGGHDDCANVVAGALAALTLQGNGLFDLYQREYEALLAAGKVRPELRGPWRW